MSTKSILIVATSQSSYPDNGDPTGLWLEELAAPYLVWVKAGFNVDIVSAKGGKIPLEPISLKPESLTSLTKTFHGDKKLMALLEATPSVKDVTGEYDAIYLPGGHGVCFDLPTDKDSIALVEKFWAEGKVVSAVCHGPCGLVNTKSANGEPLVKGKKVAGFSNSEEEAVGTSKRVPFLLETELIKQGGLYEKGADWSAYAIADGNLVTGQNPMSSEKLAELVLEALSA
jgi:putative intracellular protease/amidase